MPLARSTAEIDPWLEELWDSRGTDLLLTSGALPLIRVDGDVPCDVEDLLHDPQTSGGLLLAVAPDQIDGLRHEFTARGVSSWQIGRLTADPTGQIAVVA